MGKVLEEIRTELAGPDSPPLPPLPNSKTVKHNEENQTTAVPDTSTARIPTELEQKRSANMETNDYTTSSSSSKEDSETE